MGLLLNIYFPNFFTIFTVFFQRPLFKNTEFCYPTVLKRADFALVFTVCIYTTEQKETGT